MKIRAHEPCIVFLDIAMGERLCKALPLYLLPCNSVEEIDSTAVTCPV